MAYKAGINSGSSLETLALSSIYGSVTLSQGLHMNANIVTTDLTIPSNYNAMIVGPFSIDAVVSIEDDATFVIV